MSFKNIITVFVQKKMHIKVNLPMLKRIFPADIGAGNAPSENKKQKVTRLDTRLPSSRAGGQVQC